MTRLALDLGTMTGWALGTDPITSGTVNLKGGRFEGGGMRFVRFGRWLRDLHEDCPVTEIYFEEVRRHSGTDAAHIYGGLLGQMSTWAEEHSIPYAGIPVGVIKKHVTGSGNANKQAVIAALQARGHSPQDDNEADALAILYTVAEGAPV